MKLPIAFLTAITIAGTIAGASTAKAGFWDDVMSWGGHTGTTVNRGWLDNNMGHNTWYNEQVYLRGGSRRAPDGVPNTGGVGKAKGSPGSHTGDPGFREDS